MAGEDEVHESMTFARALRQAGGFDVKAQPNSRDEASKHLHSGELRRWLLYPSRTAYYRLGHCLMNVALSSWKEDTSHGKQSLLVLSTIDYEDTLNAATQKVMAERGELYLSESMTISGGHFAHVGDVILTRRNY